MAITAIERILGIYLAGEDLRDKQYYAVKLNTSSRWVLAGMDEDAQGILVNKPRSGQVAKVAVDGVMKAQAGGKFNPSDSLSVDSEGRLVKSTTGIAVAWATERGVAGRISSVFIGPRGKPDFSPPLAVSAIIEPGETEVVDMVDTSTTRSVKWSMTVENPTDGLYSAREVLAHHNDVTATDSQWAIQGSYSDHQVTVEFNGPYMELRVTNNGGSNIVASASVIEITKAI